MTLQANLNNQSLVQLPKIWAALSNAKNPTYSNIYNYALNAIMNSTIPLDLMNEAQKSHFDVSLYSACHDKGYFESNYYLQSRNND